MRAQERQRLVGKLVWLHWVDTSGRDGWLVGPEIGEWIAEGEAKIETVGWVIQVTADSIVVAGTRNVAMEGIGSPMKIPWCSVREVVEIVEA